MMLIKELLKISKKINKVQIKFIKKLIKITKIFTRVIFQIKYNLPYVDAKIAVSKDYFTINKNSKWITNFFSRNRVHLIRSEYDCIVSTSKSINEIIHYLIVV